MIYYFSVILPQYVKVECHIISTQYIKNPTKIMKEIAGLVWNVEMRQRVEQSNFVKFVYSSIR